MTYAARYAPFGTLLWQQGSPPGPWGFAGEFQDPTGLIYLRARWYDPGTGRFLTRDPFPGLATLPTTQHPYVYVGNNPVNLTDPSGEFAFVIPLLLGAAIGGGLAAYNYWQAQPCAAPPSLLSDPGFLRAVGIGMLSGAVGGLIGFGVGAVGVGAFGGGLAGAIITGAVGGGLIGGVGEALTQLALYGQIRNPQLVGAAMLSGVVTGGVFGAVGYGIRQALRPSGIGWTGRIGERMLRRLGGESKIYFRTSQGGRYVDQLVDRIAHESKVGYTTLTPTIQRQIAKDAELIATGRIKGAVWHFFTSPVTGQGGPSAPLAQALRNAGIQIIIY
ncbi:MAG: RHS repeat-associated core domain-containing protein [Anaerolineae bacterium]